MGRNGDGMTDCFAVRKWSDQFSNGGLHNGGRVDVPFHFRCSPGRGGRPSRDLAEHGRIRPAGGQTDANLPAYRMWSRRMFAAFSPASGFRDYDPVDATKTAPGKLGQQIAGIVHL